MKQKTKNIIWGSINIYFINKWFFTIFSLICILTGMFTLYPTKFGMWSNDFNLAIQLLILSGIFQIIQTQNKHNEN